MDWHKCSESFIHIVDSQSFTKAARERFTSGSALSKHVNWLESQLGVQLLQRTTRHLELTEEGEHFYLQARQLLEEWYNLKESLSNRSNEPHGTLNIGLSIILGNHYIAPLLPKLLTQYTHLKINLKTLTYPLSINLESLDICISHKSPDVFSEAMAHRVLGEYHLHVFASPDYLKKHGTPQSLEDLKQHNCLLNAGSNYPGRWEFENNPVQVQGNLTADNGGALVKAAVSGLGLIFTSPFVIANEPEAALTMVLPEHRSSQWNVYAYYPKRKKLPLKTKFFLDYIASRLNIH